MNIVNIESQETTEAIDSQLAVSPIKLKALEGKFQRPAKKQPSLLMPSNRTDKGLLQNLFAHAPRQRGEKEDGIDHINVSEDGVTELGRLLDINAHTPFVHPELNRFASLGGLWLFIRSAQKEDSLRYIWGKNCRSAAKKLQVVNVTGFKTIIAYATWFKVASNPHLVQLIVDSELPFSNYFYFGELKLRRQTGEAVWYVKILEEIRRTLKLRDAQQPDDGSEPAWPDFSGIERE